MVLCTKLDKQMDKYYEVVSLNKSSTKQKFNLKTFIAFVLMYL